jgi:hypothetical protein
VGSIERVQRGFVKFWVVRPHAGSAPPLLCHHLGMRQIRARCSSAPPLPGWAPFDPWCTSLGKSGSGQVPWHDATQREVCLSGRPTRRREKPGPASKTRLRRRSRRGYFRRCTHRTSSSCRPRCHRWPCDTAIESQLVRLRRVQLCAAMCRTWEGRFSLQVVMTMVGAVGA